MKMLILGCLVLLLTVTPRYSAAPADSGVTCDRPHIENGNIPRGSWFGFIRKASSEIEYKCNRGFLTAGKEIFEKSQCTENGWSPQPKCTRSCASYEAAVTNGRLGKTERDYLSGDKVDFTCNAGYFTPQGKDHGEMECLPIGVFTEAKCSRYCALNQLTNGNYEPKKELFEEDESVKIQCNNGYMTENRKLQENIQCLSEGWQVNPQCIEVTCSLDANSLLQSDKGEYKANEVARFSCPRGYLLAGDERSQCYYYGWDPKLPTCKAFILIDAVCFVSSDFLIPSRKNYALGEEMTFSCSKGHRLIGESRVKCSYGGWYPRTPSCETEQCVVRDDLLNPDKKEYPIDENVQFSCPDGYTLEGKSAVLCTRTGWADTLPTCKAKVCETENRGLLILSPHQQKYILGATVEFECPFAFQVVGASRSTCTAGGWRPALPTCEAQVCEIGNPGLLILSPHKQKYNLRAIVEFACPDAFQVVGPSRSTCTSEGWRPEFPTCEATSCPPPPSIDNGRPVPRLKAEYASGDKVQYMCNSGYNLKKRISDAVCEASQWKSIPVCRRAGASCSTPPAVLFGEFLGPNQPVYRSGSDLEYKCPQYFTLQGNKRVKCEDGEWDEPPFCLQPCAAREKEMRENNIVFKWTDANKLYTNHDETMEFLCAAGYEIGNNSLLRVKCNNGVIPYPKCNKIGSCLLSEETMKNQNIYINRSSAIQDGEKVTFECNKGMIPEKTLEGTCKMRVLNYPRCITANKCKSAPAVPNGRVKADHLKQDGYDTGSSVEFECDEHHGISGPINVKCENGQWSDLPQCLKPCRISQKDLNANHVELISRDDEKKVFKDGEEVDVQCKAGSKSPFGGIERKGECSDGKMRNIRCFEGAFCRLNQDQIDGRNLELDLTRNSDGYYADGEDVHFVCKEGFNVTGSLDGKCENKDLTYPLCAPPEESSG